MLCACLVARQNSISLAAVLPYNGDCAIANGESGVEQLGHFVGEKQGEGIVPLVTESPTLMAGAAGPANSAGWMYSRIN